MLKNAAVQDPEANAKKDATDRRAGELLHVDFDKVRADAESLYQLLNRRLGKGPYEGSLDRIKMVVTGGAGSGKTSLAIHLALRLGVKHLDMDKYLPGGFTADKDEYARRINKALYEMWEDIPAKSGWVIDHVEAASREVVGLLNPTFALLIDPGVERLRSVAEARGSEENDGAWRLARAIQSANTASKQFTALSGDDVPTGMNGFHLKDLRGL